MDWVSAAGSVLSLIGVVIAIIQIRKVRTSSDAAKNAALHTSVALQLNMSMIDISGCINLIEEIKTLVRSGRYEAALLRVSDLMGKMIQIKSFPTTPNMASMEGMQSMLAQLGVLRDLLERKIHKASTQISQSQVNKTLSGIADDLNAWIGSNRFHTQERNHD